MSKRRYSVKSERGPGEADRTGKLLELLRSARGPEPSPEYLAAFWPRLREKLGPRPKAVLRPIYYGGLAAAAAALVLWVALPGPDPAGITPSEFPVYALGTASCPVEGDRTETNYISGAPRGGDRGRPNGIDYVLPRIAARRDARLEV